MANLLTYNVKGSDLALIQQDGRLFVACQPVVDAIGLDWEGQYQLISRDEALKSTVYVMPIIVENGQSYNQLCVPLERLSSCLSKISSRLIKDPKVKARLILFQEECCAALNHYFFLN